MLDSHTAYDEAIELLVQICSIPSYSREEENKANYIQQWIISRGYQTEMIGNNIIVRSDSWDNDLPTLLLNSHIDTVRPSNMWDTPPHTPTTIDQQVFALGINDAGASLVTLLQVFRLLNNSNQKYNIIFLASAEEEVSGKGGVESVVSYLANIDLAIVGEPTNMQLAVAERGLIVFDGCVRGKAGHAARQEGVNAIYKALPIIDSLRNFVFERVSPTLGYTHLAVTQINAGSQHNVIPDSCNFVVDVRTNDHYTNQEIIDILTEVSQDTLTPRSSRLQSSSLDISHPLCSRAAELGISLFGSPTLSDQSLMPWPSAKIGPGDSARSHTANEYIYTYEIKDAIELYVELLDKLEIPKFSK